SSAEYYLKRAYEIYLTNFGNKNRDVSNVLTYLGQHYQNINDYRKALNFYQQAIVSFIEDYNDNDIYKNPDLQFIEPDLNIFYTLQSKAFTFYEYYKNKTELTKDLVASLETCQLAVQLFDIIKSSYGEENTKLVVTTKVNEIFDLSVIVAAELFEITKDKDYLNLAFEFSEKGKAAVLLSSLREFEAMEIGDIPLEIREKEKFLNKDISLYKKLVYDESQKVNPDSSKVTAWKNQIFEKTKSHDSLVASIENEYPEYYNLKYNFQVLNLENVQDILNENEAFIEYKIADSILISFLITRDTILLNKKLIESDFSYRIENLVGSINKLSEDFGSKEQYISFSQQSHYMYNVLIEPLGLSENQSTIIIIPDDILGYLNFEILIKKQPDLQKVDYKNLDYLINSHSISYGYSGTILFQRQISKKGNNKLLAMAPSYQFNENNNSNVVASIRDLKENLNPLDYIIDEVERVNSIFKGRLFIEEEATEANFKAHAHKYNILHFAMHTLVNDENPLASKLVFTLNNDSIEDGFLNTYEIYNLDLNAELAVLSACKTGVGKLSKGEGIMSLARGFLYAGVPGIVMTLWEIEDISSVEIMTGFYRNLKKGMKKDDALRNSKLSYLESSDPVQSHPYFWAAYVQIGNNNPVITYSKYMYFIYAAILLSLIGILYFLMYKRRKKY
ncbi:MAG: CHAT domain-containing protein, partial [Bacteroidales bacterium]|nr:CHAT domain-containing protein [Bacteroidales bacterium]